MTCLRVFLYFYTHVYDGNLPDGTGQNNIYFAAKAKAELYFL